MTAESSTWTPVCAVDAMIPDAGVTALVAGTPVAVFVLTGGEVCAIDAIDPFSGAMVLARGLIGSAGPVAYVASPMLKQRFSLVDGSCLDDEAVSVAVWATRVVNGQIEVAAQPPPALTSVLRPRS